MKRYAMSVLAAPGAPLNRELKFVFSTKRADRIVAWVERHCRPDGEYPSAIVASIYYDTPRWHCLDEKLNSDYLKSKFRLRWYRQKEHPVADADPVFVEAKYRTGSSRRKLHVSAPFSAAWLRNMPLEDHRLRQFNDLLCQNGVVIAQRLVPVFVVEYERRRYLDPVSGARLCVDTDIRVPRWNRMMVPIPLPARLETSVLEVKGQHVDLPPHLYPVTDLGCRRGSFSKYAACFQKLMGNNF